MPTDPADADAIAEALAVARRSAHHLLRVEVEVETLQEAEIAVRAGAEWRLLLAGRDGGAPGDRSGDGAFIASAKTASP